MYVSTYIRNDKCVCMRVYWLVFVVVDDQYNTSRNKCVCVGVLCVCATVSGSIVGSVGADSVPGTVQPSTSGAQVTVPGTLCLKTRREHTTSRIPRVTLHVVCVRLYAHYHHTHHPALRCSCVYSALAVGVIIDSCLVPPLICLCKGYA